MMESLPQIPVTSFLFKPCSKSESKCRQKVAQSKPRLY